MTKSVGTPAPNPFPMLDSVMWPNSLCIQFQSVSKNRQQSHASILKRGRGGVSSEEKNSKCTKIDCRRDPAPLIGLSLSGLLDFILPVYFLLFFFLVFSKKSKKIILRSLLLAAHPFIFTAMLLLELYGITSFHTFN